MIERKKLRFAVLVDSAILKQWQIDSIENLLKSDGSECVCFIKNTSKLSSSNSKTSIGFRLLYKGIDHNGPLSIVDWTKQFKSSPVLNFNPVKKGISSYLNEEDMTHFRALNLDFVLRFGFGILKGEALTIPTYGIWSFHHGNPEYYRGGPAGLWEIIQKDRVTGSILQQLNEKLDQGNVLRQGFFQTIDHSYKANLHHILDESSKWPSLVVTSILAHPEKHLATSPISNKGKLYKIPSNWNTLKLVFTLFENKIAFHLNRLFNAEKWNIGTVNQPIEDLVTNNLNKIKWLNEAPKNLYFADPFPWKDDQILLELYSYKTEKGALKTLDRKSGKLTDFKNSETHSSYPFTLEFEGKNYILPENYRSKSLHLFEVKDDLTIEAKHELIKGEWIDPSLIQYNGRWWLFCTHQSSPKENLYIFYSKSITGPYTAHLMNPVLTDIRSARPGGTPFVVNGKIIRPTQNCATTYGGSIVLKQIETLNATEYSERFLKEILPPKGRYSKGLHTLSKADDKILVDGKRYHFNISNFIHQLKSSFKK